MTYIYHIVASVYPSSDNILSPVPSLVLIFDVYATGVFIYLLLMCVWEEKETLLRQFGHNGTDHM